MLTQIKQKLDNVITLTRQENALSQNSGQHLGESETHYRNLFENNHATMLIIDPESAAIVAANPAACAYYGWSREALLKMRMDEINTLTIEEIQAEMQLARAEKRNQFIFKHRRADGSIRDVEIYSGPIEMAGKTLLYSIVHDITERKQAEMALVESQVLTSAIIDSTSDMIWSVDPEYFGLQMFNRALSEYFFQQRRIHIHNGMRPEDLFPTEEFINLWRAFYQRALKEGPYTTEYVVYAGKTTLQLTFNLLNRDDKVFGISVFGKDITERKAAEEALRKSEAHMEEAQRVAKMGSWQRALGTDAMDWSDETFRIFGWEKHNPVPYQQFMQCVHPEDVERLRRAQQNALERNIPLEIEYRIIRPDGSIRHLREIGGMVVDEKTGAHLAGMVMDITVRKQTEIALESSQKLAEIGTLTAGIMHEIRSPLQIITGVSDSFLAALEASNPELERMQRQSQMLSRNAWRIVGIANSLLRYARASDGERESNDINEIVQDTLLLIQHQLACWSNITVVADLAPNLPLLYCDRNKITQVLINLLTNARDAMPNGGEIAIATQSDSVKNCLVLCVMDQGTGIPEAEREKIFAPFFTTKAAGQGTGLGLSIVREIVDSHQGQIEVESAPGRGTTFRLCFPLDGQDIP